MKVKIILISKTSVPYLKTGINEFLQRCKHYLKLEWVELDCPKKWSKLPTNQQKILEAELILNNIQKSDKLIVLDEKGKTLSSEEFAVFFEKNYLSNQSLVFVIGGAFGFNQAVYDRANQLISLSKMTFTHQMARLILIEQIYRAHTIINNEQYHNP